MKPWMKFLMWFGLGTALGLSAGHQIGYNKAKHEDEQIVNNAYSTGHQDGITAFAERVIAPSSNDYQQAVNHLRERYGFSNPQEQYVDPPQPATDVVCCEHDLPNEEEDAEMPMEEPVVPEPENEGVRVESRSEEYPEGSITYGVIKGPGDIPQFHPTYEIPRIVTEEEYDSYGDLDEKVLIYYEGDDVLYCVEDQKPIGEDEQPCLIGIGTLQGFRVGPGEPKDELFVVNETYGRFKILRMDDAFADAVDGTCAPDDDDDFWNDGDG